jgi:hypothetical protein
MQPQLTLLAIMNRNNHNNQPSATPKPTRHPTPTQGPRQPAVPTKHHHQLAATTYSDLDAAAAQPRPRQDRSR